MTPGVERRTAERVGLVEYAQMMFVAAMYSGALMSTVRLVMNGGRVPPGESDVASTVGGLFALVMVAAWLLAGPRRSVPVVRALALPLAVCALCLVSAAWSPLPWLTLRRSVALLTCMLYGAYLQERLGLGGIIRLLLRTYVLLAAASVAAYVAVPSVGHDTLLTYESAMRGVFASKNTAAMGLVLGIGCAVYAGRAGQPRRVRCAVALLVLLGALVLTRSATSAALAALVLGVGARWWLRRPALRLAHAALLTAAAMTLLFSVLFWPDALLALTGRDASLTGRVPLWAATVDLIAARPWLGHGYAAFWTLDGRDLQYLWRTVRWEPPNAHDGYLDTALQIGLVGLLLHMAVWVRVLAGAVQGLRRRPMEAGKQVNGVPYAGWMLLLMGVTVLLNLDEAPLAYPNQFTLAVAACCTALARPRPAAMPGAAPARLEVLKTGAVA